MMGILYEFRIDDVVILVSSLSVFSMKRLLRELGVQYTYKALDVAHDMPV